MSCVLGEVVQDEAIFEQTDGALEVGCDVLIGTLDGGVDADGAFEIGGNGFVFGGEREFNVLVTGEFTADAGLSASEKGNASGSLDGQPLDCVMEYSLSGQRNMP